MKFAYPLLMLLYLLFTLTRPLQAQATLPDPYQGVVQIYENENHHLGHGVWLQPNVALTNHHVVDGVPKELLSIKDSKGITHSVIEVFLPKRRPDPQAPKTQILRPLPEYADYAFLISTGGTKTPWSEEKRILSQNTTMVVHNDDDWVEEDSFHNEEAHGFLLHCSESVSGYSGAPIFNPRGELVALQIGVVEMNCFCPMSYTSEAVPIHKILESLPSFLPEVLPYLYPTH